MAGGKQQICGLARKTFFIVLVVALVIIAAAIGGGVGGGISARNRQSGNDNSPSSSSSTPTPTHTKASSQSMSATSSTSSSAPTATAPLTLNNMTSPSDFAFQGFTKPNYLGRASKVFTKKGFYDLGLDAISYVWQTNGSCCVTFCADRHEATGWRCEPRKRDEASGTFPRIFVWCDGDLDGTHKNANETCS